MPELIRAIRALVVDAVIRAFVYTGIWAVIVLAWHYWPVTY